MYDHRQPHHPIASDGDPRRTRRNPRDFNNRAYGILDVEVARGAQQVGRKAKALIAPPGSSALHRVRDRVHVMRDHRQAIRFESMRRWWRLKVRHRIYWRLARRARRVHGHGPLLVAIGDSNTDPQCAFTLPRQVWLRIVGHEGYKTVNLGVSGDTTGDMRLRIEQTLGEGQPEIVVVFGGANDARLGVDPAETERNVTFMAEWLRDHAIRKVVLIGPPLMNWQPTPDWVSSAEEVQKVLRDVAERYGAVCVDLARFLRGRIERGEDPDFSRVRYRQSRSWHVGAGDPHLNAYGQRLVAEAFLAATAGWRSSRGRRRPWLLRRERW